MKTLPFVKKKSVKQAQLRPNSDPTPSFVRFQKICTFADVGKYPQRSPTDSGMINFSIMSKGNMLLGHARGKVGSLVFSRANGKQIVRSRAEVVKNPRTQAQMIQRIMLNTVAQGYSNMKAIVDHSFEGLSAGQASMSYFMQRNLDNLRTKVANEIAEGKSLSEIIDFTPLKTNVLAVNAYEIAKGTLPSIGVLPADDSRSYTFMAAANTYEGIMQRYGLKRGDQLTFIALVVGTDGNIKFQYNRVILDPRETDGTEAPLSTEFCANNAVVKPSTRNEGVFNTLEFTNGKIVFALSTSFVWGGAIIVSRKANDGSWLRSNATLEINTESHSGSTSLQTALDLLAQSGIDGLSDLYLNNAGTSNVNSGTTQSGNGGGSTGGGPSQEG